MHENLIRQFSIIGVSVLNLAITIWYCWLTYKQKIRPALAMWIFFTIAVAISLTTYMESAHFSLLDNILNTTDLALTAIVSIAIYLFGDHTSRFSRFDKGCLLAVTIILLFWFITALWFLGQPAVVERVFPWYIYFPALAALILGNGATLYMNLVALREDDRADLIVPALTVPAFFVMMSIAAAKGTYQLIRNPSYWEKTFHGLSQKPDAGPTGS